jgi:hypothetical protein
MSMSDKIEEALRLILSNQAEIMRFLTVSHKQTDVHKSKMDLLARARGTDELKAKLFSN